MNKSILKKENNNATKQTRKTKKRKEKKIIRNNNEFKMLMLWLERCKRETKSSNNNSNNNSNNKIYKRISDRKWPDDRPPALLHFPHLNAGRIPGRGGNGSPGTGGSNNGSNDGGDVGDRRGAGRSRGRQWRCRRRWQELRRRRLIIARCIKHRRIMLWNDTSALSEWIN